MAIEKLDDIGFYTLSDKRAKDVSWKSDLQRCELILTHRCNFKCVYCRGVKKELQGDLTFEQAKEIIDIWCSGNLHNIRFSGGEPTLYKDIIDLVKYTKSKPSIEHIGLSTNGSAAIGLYGDLFDAGVNDFSISLDSCCSVSVDYMSGTNSKIDHICNVIKYLSKKTYVTVGIVLTDFNNGELKKTIDHATNLGVSDIRIIPSAQSNHHINIDIQTKYKILKYRIDRFKNGAHVRGIKKHNCKKCHLVKDDMIILHGEHFPCVIYMREQGKSIGSVYGKSLKQIRQERKIWFESTDTHLDPICLKNCLDFCIEHNDAVDTYEKSRKK